MTNKELFGLGCLSGFIAQTVIYPLEVLKTQGKCIYRHDLHEKRVWGILSGHANYWTV